jgi:hypothetical protein
LIVATIDDPARPAKSRATAGAPSLRPGAARFALRSLAAARDDVGCGGPRSDASRQSVAPLACSEGDDGNSYAMAIDLAQSA